MSYHTQRQAVCHLKLSLTVCLLHLYPWLVAQHLPCSRYWLSRFHTQASETHKKMYGETLERVLGDQGIKGARLKSASLVKNEARRFQLEKLCKDSPETEKDIVCSGITQSH